MGFHLFGPRTQQPHADLVAQIAQVTAFRDGAANDADASKRLVSMEQALRVQLAQTPEHRAGVAQWRARAEANARRRRMVMGEDGPQTA